MRRRYHCVPFHLPLLLAIKSRPKIDPKAPFPTPKPIPASGLKWTEEGDKSYKSFAVFVKYQPVFYPSVRLIPAMQQTNRLCCVFCTYLVSHTKLDPEWEERKSEITANKSWRDPSTPTPQWRLLCLSINAETSPRLEAMSWQKSIAKGVLFAILIGIQTISNAFHRILIARNNFLCPVILSKAFQVVIE